MKTTKMFLLWVTMCFIATCGGDSRGFSAKYNENYFWFSTEKKTFNDATIFCQNLGGHLTWVESEPEMKWLASKMTQVESVVHWYNGLNDLTHSNDISGYEWVSGAPVTYRNFAPREPSHDHEGCVTMEQSKRYAWADITCSRAEAFICKMNESSLEMRQEIFLGHIYHLSDTGMSFADAQNFCEGLDGGLVWFESLSEEDWLVRNLQERRQVISYIGLYQPHNVYSRASDHLWVSGHPTRYTAFAPGEPSNTATHCVAIAGDKGWKWTDVSCGRQEPFVCKISMKGNTKPPVISSNSYYFSNARKSRNDAEQFCQGLNGHLVWIDSRFENYWLAGQIFLSSSQPYWYIGYNASSGAGASCWVGGQPCRFSEFAASEPNGANEQCVTIEATKRFQWADVTCQRNEHFICKIPRFVWNRYRRGSFQYFFSTSRLNQIDAEQFCESLNGNLAWIDNPQEMNWIRQILLRDFADQTFQYWYIGLKDFVGNGRAESYQWLGGATVNFTYFASGQPGYDNERCVTTERPSGFRWHDVRCSRKESFICKRPAPE